MSSSMAKQGGKTKSSKSKKPANKGKKKHKVTNWHEYNEALRQRGSLDVWIEKGLVEGWVETPEGGRKKLGGQKKYSNLAITTTLQFGVIFHQRLRQTEGFVRSVFSAMGLPLPIPDFSTLSRRGAGVVIDLPRVPRDKVVAIMDSSGLKVFGEGEWKVRQHGYSKRRTWRKVHIDVAPDGEIRAVELTDNGHADSQVAPRLMIQETADIEALVGDGGYDRKSVYAAGIALGVKEFRIPPQHNAKILQHGNRHTEPHPRDENLRAIRLTSRKRWKESIKYHVRSISENAFYRLKTIFGDRLQARQFAGQTTETLIKMSVLNKMRLLGMPQTVAVA